MRGFKKGCQHFAGGGAAKGVPSMMRKGHPVAAKKALISPPPAPVAGAAGPKVALPALGSLVGGAMGRGMGQVALPQGATPPTEITPRKMVTARPPKLS